MSIFGKGGRRGATPRQWRVRLVVLWGPLVSFQCQLFSYCQLNVLQQRMLWFCKYAVKTDATTVGFFVLLVGGGVVGLVGASTQGWQYCVLCGGEGGG